mmetsp:Transcript_42775/g.76748  ORF Transcript_42775/g.76748 Transcript_42775/m.76748 type:complete len:230 (-) Transcript_42775:1747-2436(-)
MWRANTPSRVANRKICVIRGSSSIPPNKSCSGEATFIHGSLWWRVGGLLASRSLCAALKVMPSSGYAAACLTAIFRLRCMKIIARLRCSVQACHLLLPLLHRVPFGQAPSRLYRLLRSLATPTTALLRNAWQVCELRLELGRCGFTYVRQHGMAVRAVHVVHIFRAVTCHCVLKNSIVSRRCFLVDFDKAHGQTITRASPKPFRCRLQGLCLRSPLPVKTCQESTYAGI